MAGDLDWLLRYSWFKSTGTPPKAFNEFQPLTLQAFLLHLGDSIKTRAPSLAPTTLGSPVRGPPAARTSRRWEDPILTGDPVVDEWERQIAAGRTPDFSLKPTARRSIWRS